MTAKPFCCASSPRLKSVDCLLLHCPEYESKAGVDMTEIYSRMSILAAKRFIQIYSNIKAN